MASSHQQMNNNTFSSPDWEVIRRIGIGDMQHVRSHLLSIGCFHERNLVPAISACYAAGVELNMMVRVHINAAKIPDAVLQKAIKECHRFMQHDAQLIEHSTLDRQSFIQVFETCDMIVQPKAENGTRASLTALIIEAWLKTGSRFLNGNFGRASADELRERFPHFWPDSEPFYQDFSNANSK